MIRAVIADDHPAFTLGLRLSLPDHGIEVLDAVLDGLALIASVERHKPDAIITDVRMPHVSGIEACQQLRKRGSTPVVVILSTYGDVATVAAAARAGARAFLSKDATPAEIAATVKQLFADRSRNLISSPVLPELTPREAEVLKALSQGMSNKQISRNLGIGVETVKYHCSHLFSKLGVSDRLTAVSEARKLGLID